METILRDLSATSAYQGTSVSETPRLPSLPAFQITTASAAPLVSIVLRVHLRQNLALLEHINLPQANPMSRLAWLVTLAFTRMRSHRLLVSDAPRVVTLEQVPHSVTVSARTELSSQVMVGASASLGMSLWM